MNGTVDGWGAMFLAAAATMIGNAVGLPGWQAFVLFLLVMFGSVMVTMGDKGRYFRRRNDEHS